MLLSHAPHAGQGEYPFRRIAARLSAAHEEGAPPDGEPRLEKKVRLHGIADRDIKVDPSPCFSRGERTAEKNLRSLIGSAPRAELKTCGAWLADQKSPGAA
jgi:hypothetical protein